jgi:hypothetical protein
MPHVRQLVREGIRQKCEDSGAVPANDVHVSRVYKFDSNQVPAINVFTQGENVLPKTEGRKQPGIVDRKIITHVHIAATAENNLEDVLDGLALLVEDEIMKDPCLGGVAYETRLRMVQIDDDKGADRPLGVLMMVFESMVLTQEGDAATNF